MDSQVKENTIILPLSDLWLMYKNSTPKNIAIFSDKNDDVCASIS
jgi:hypothetical protein